MKLSNWLLARQRNKLFKQKCFHSKLCFNKHAQVYKIKLFTDNWGDHQERFQDMFTNCPELKDWIADTLTVIVEVEQEEFAYVNKGTLTHSVNMYKFKMGTYELTKI